MSPATQVSPPEPTLHVAIILTSPSGLWALWATQPFGVLGSKERSRPGCPIRQCIGRFLSEKSCRLLRSRPPTAGRASVSSRSSGVRTPPPSSPCRSFQGSTRSGSVDGLASIAISAKWRRRSGSARRRPPLIKRRGGGGTATQGRVSPGRRTGPMRGRWSGIPVRLPRQQRAYSFRSHRHERVPKRLQPRLPTEQQSGAAPPPTAEQHQAHQRQ